MKAKKLVLKNGMEFIGQGFGCDKVAEVIFNTSMISLLEYIRWFLLAKIVSLLCLISN